MTGQLILLRHGQSTSNAAGTFTGLLDVPLTPRGEMEAAHAADLLCSSHIRPDQIVTSVLSRAVHTARIIADTLGLQAPIEWMWQLNERNYGALTGRAKADVLREFGAEAYMVTRRSLRGRPPEMTETMWQVLRNSPALRGLPAQAVRRTESLQDVVDRISPILVHRFLPAVQHGQTLLVVAHGNSLRALVSCLDELTEEQVQALNLPTGEPLRYWWSKTRGWSPRHGAYLDPSAVRAAAAIAAEGGT